MTWDVVLIKMPEGVSAIAEVPEDYLAPLGQRAEVEAAIRRALPGVDLTEPDWGRMAGPGWSMELNIGHKDRIDDIMLHIRASSEWVFGPISDLARELQCQAVDCGSGETLALVEPGVAEMAEWNDNRDRRNGFGFGFTTR